MRPKSPARRRFLKGALGAALYVWYQILENPRRPDAGDSMRGSYLGPAYSEKEVCDFLGAAGARYTPRGSDPATDPDGGWVHPKDLHGLLLGISRTGLAWDWSGRKELVPAA